MRAKSASRLIQILVLLIVVAPVILFQSTVAAELSQRRVGLDDSSASVTTAHRPAFVITTAGVIGSMSFEYCDNSPLVDVACSAPSGLDVSAASVDSESGVTGFSPHANTTANRLVITRPPAAAAAVPVEYEFGNIINPDTPQTHFVRISTYPTTDGTGPATDQGSVAISINDGVDVSAFVPPVLEFCVGVAVTSSDCTNVVGSNINFGNFSPAATSFATTQMAAGTNGVGGYSITVTGTTMTSGNNTIAALNAPAAAAPGSSQFGMNLRDNSSPNVGQNITGVGTGAVLGNYNLVDSFVFNNGDVVASSPLSTEFNKYTVSYIVNVNPAQPPGVYATTISFIALATF